MRPISDDVYGIPRERVIGSSTALAYAGDRPGGMITRKAELDYLDDGPEKPARIWSRTGRRPLLAAGNSNGDVPMLEFAHHSDLPTLRLLIVHDDDEREFDVRLRRRGRARTSTERRLDHRQHQERLGHGLLRVRAELVRARLRFVVARRGRDR